jgi:hypothetical protein
LASSPRRRETTAKTRDEPPLPPGLNRTRVIARAYIVDRFGVRDPVKDREARQRGSRATAPAAADNLDPLGLGAQPNLDQRVTCVVRIGRQPEVAPPDPACRPSDRWGPLGLQVETKLG